MADLPSRIETMLRSPARLAAAIFLSLFPTARAAADPGASFEPVFDDQFTSSVGDVTGIIGLDIYRRDSNVVYAIVEARRGRGRGVYRSDHRGETWELRSETNPRPMYYSPIRVDPDDPQRVYPGGTSLYISDDGGKSFRSERSPGADVDHHAHRIDPGDSNHLPLGNDGGVDASFDRAESWRMYDNMALGQFYEIGVDMQDPYRVCGGLQDNGSWCGPSRTYSRAGILNSDWLSINGGDGFYTVIDPDDPAIVFAESRNGNLARVDLSSYERARIRPVGRPGERENEERSLRWNWDSPISMSSHDPATIYHGSNILWRSRDPGHSWEEASPDLTKGLDRVQAFLEDREDVPESVREEAEALTEEVGELEGEIQDRSRDALRSFFHMEGSTSRPTEDHLWRLERVWEGTGSAIGKVNEIVEGRMPELYRLLNQHGIRPEPGEPVELPKRPGR